MDQERIRQRFAFLARLSLEEAAEWELLCEDAAKELQAQRRPEEEEAAAEELLCAAAAALAFYRYTRLKEIDGEGDVTLGDIRITRKQGALSIARQIWEEARAQAAPLLEDRDFLFERMGGGV